jgi:hypothetical protein
MKIGSILLPNDPICDDHHGVREAREEIKEGFALRPHFPNRRSKDHCEDNKANDIRA